MFSFDPNSKLIIFKPLSLHVIISVMVCVINIQLDQQTG